MRSERSELERIPIIRVWNLVLVPLQGDISDDLSERLTLEVLNRIHADGSSGLVIDVTALWIMDSHLCSVISRLAQAAGLMGTRTLLCGMSPEIALTLQTMGLDLHAVETTLSLEEALERLGVQPPRDALGAGDSYVTAYDDADLHDEAPGTAGAAE